MLKSHICPTAKLGHFLILNTNFSNIPLKKAENARFRVKNAYFLARQTKPSTWVGTPKGVFLVVNVRFFIKSVLKVKCKVSAAFCYYPKEENKKCHSD